MGFCKSRPGTRRTFLETLKVSWDLAEILLYLAKQEEVFEDLKKATQDLTKKNFKYVRLQKKKLRDICEIFHNNLRSKKCNVGFY